MEEGEESKDDDVLLIAKENQKEIEKLDKLKRKNLQQFFSPDVEKKTKRLLGKALLRRRQELALNTHLVSDDETDFSDFKPGEPKGNSKPKVKLKTRPANRTTRAKRLKNEKEKKEQADETSEAVVSNPLVNHDANLKERVILAESGEDSCSSSSLKGNKKNCHICNEEILQASLKDHLIQCMKEKFERDKKNSENVSRELGKICCPVCGKDLQLFNIVGRTEHINKCIDQPLLMKTSDETQNDEFNNLLQNARTAVMVCPMCGKKVQTLDSRKRHIKQCALANNMTVDQVRSLISQQAEEYHNQLDAGVLPQDFRPPTKQAKPKGTRKPSKFGEDVQLAKALSTSMAEFQSCNQMVPELKKPSKPEGGKRSKQNKASSLLLTLTKEQASERVSNQVASYIFSASPEDEVSKTPAFKQRKKNSSVSEPDSLWSKTSFASLSLEEPTTQPSTSTSPASPLPFYVKALMPAVSVSTVLPGSKLKRCSLIPGRGHSIGPADLGVLEEAPCHVDTEETVTSMDITDSPNSPSSPDTASQTLTILAQLAAENEVGDKSMYSQPDQNDSDNVTTLSDCGSEKGIEKESSAILDVANGPNCHESVKSVVSSIMDSGEEVEKELTLGNEGIISNCGDVNAASINSNAGQSSTVQNEDHGKESGSVDSLSSALLSLVNNSAYSDVTIKASGGNRVAAHRNILLARCPLLHDMHIQENEGFFIDMSDFNKDSILDLLSYIYGGNVCRQSMEERTELEELAKRFSLEPLLKAIKRSETNVTMTHSASRVELHNDEEELIGESKLVLDDRNQGNSDRMDHLFPDNERETSCEENFDRMDHLAQGNETESCFQIKNESGNVDDRNEDNPGRTDLLLECNKKEPAYTDDLEKMDLPFQDNEEQLVDEISVGYQNRNNENENDSEADQNVKGKTYSNENAEEHCSQNYRQQEDKADIFESVAASCETIASSPENANNVPEVLHEVNFHDNLSVDLDAMRKSCGNLSGDDDPVRDEVPSNINSVNDVVPGNINSVKDVVPGNINSVNDLVPGNINSVNDVVPDNIHSASDVGAVLAAERSNSNPKDVETGSNNLNYLEEGGEVQNSLQGMETDNTIPSLVVEPELPDNQPATTGSSELHELTTNIVSSEADEQTTAIVSCEANKQTTSIVSSESPAKPPRKRKRVTVREFKEIIQKVSQSVETVDDEDYSRIVVKIEQLEKQSGQHDMNDSVFIPSVLEDFSNLNPDEIQITDAFITPKKSKKRKRVSTTPSGTTPVKKSKLDHSSKIGDKNSSCANLTSDTETTGNINEELSLPTTSNPTLVNKSPALQDSADKQASNIDGGANASVLLFDSDNDLFSSEDEDPSIPLMRSGKEDNMVDNINAKDKCQSPNLNTNQSNISQHVEKENTDRSYISLDVKNENDREGESMRHNSSLNNRETVLQTLVEEIVSLFDFFAAKRKKQAPPPKQSKLTPRKVSSSNIRPNQSIPESDLNENQPCLTENTADSNAKAFSSTELQSSNVCGLGKARPQQQNSKTAVIPTTIDSFTEQMVLRLPPGRHGSKTLPQSPQILSSTPKSTAKRHSGSLAVKSLFQTSASNTTPTPVPRTSPCSVNPKPSPQPSAARSSLSVAPTALPITDSTNLNSKSSPKRTAGSLWSHEPCIPPRPLLPSAKKSSPGKRPPLSPKFSSELATTPHSSSSTASTLTSASRLDGSSRENIMTRLSPKPGSSSDETKSPVIKKNKNLAVSTQQLSEGSPLSLRERLGLSNPFGPKPTEAKALKTNPVTEAISLKRNPVTDAKALKKNPVTEAKALKRNPVTEAKALKKNPVKTDIALNKIQPRKPSTAVEPAKDGECWSDDSDMAAIELTPELNKRVLKLKKDDKRRVPSPFTPMAPYDNMNTPELKKAVHNIGVRPMAKKRMRVLLKHVYEETHQYETDSDCAGTPVQPSQDKNRRGADRVRSQQVTSKAPFTQLSQRVNLKGTGSSTGYSDFSSSDDMAKGKVPNDCGKGKVLPPSSTSSAAAGGVEDMEDDMIGSQDSIDSDTPDMPEESILQLWPEEEEMEAPCTQMSQTSMEALSNRLMEFLRDNPKIYEQILMYEALELDVLKKQISEAGIRIGLSRLQDFLDERCITYSMKNMSNRNNRQLQKQKKAKGNSPRKRKPTSKTTQQDKL